MRTIHELIEDAQLLARMERLQRLEKLAYFIDGGYESSYETVIIGQQPWIVQYKGRKHVYAYTAQAGIVLTSSDYSIALIQNGWTNVAVPDGTRFTGPSGLTIAVKCTDEVELSVVATGGTSGGGLVTASTSALTSVPASVSSTTLLAANVNRKQASIFNDSTATLFLGLTASAVSTANYTTQVPPNSLYELIYNPLWVGQINGLWSSAVGNARVTELT